MARNYYLGPWIWDDGWQPPSGTVGLVDLRSIPAAGQAINPTGYGFFATEAPLSGDYIPFGDSLSASMGQSERTNWSTALGIPRAGQMSLLDLLWDTLTLKADPDGLLMCPPILPNTPTLDLQLHLGGHSLVRSQTMPKAGQLWTRIQAKLRADYRRIRQDALNGHLGKSAHLKWLGWMVKVYKMPGRTFIPDDLPNEKPGHPDTDLLDDLNRTDQLNLGTSAEGWSWASITGNWAITNNEARGNATGSSTDLSARAESDLSASDHTVSGDFAAQSGANNAGPIARFSASAFTGYVFWLSTFFSNVQLTKIINGTRTGLSSVSRTYASLTFYDLSLNVNGSTLTGSQSGFADLTATDSAIAGNLRTGLSGRNLNAYFACDNFFATDGLSASSGLLLRRRMAAA